MKKLFKAIRNNEFETVKAIIEKEPQLVNCVAVPPPKKDNGQSPLQVALKTGMYEIADYLIDHGADVNFMEAEDDDPGMRAPVLFDAVNAVLSELYYYHEASGYGKSRIERSDKALKLTEKILAKGADANKFNSEGMDAWEYTVHTAENLLSSEIYKEAWELCEKQTAAIFRLLEKYGADKYAWLDRNFGDATNRSLYYDEFVPKPDSVIEMKFRGKIHKTVIKGDIDRTAAMRRFMRNYYAE